MKYIPSKLLSGETTFLREHSFTRWMSIELLQAATDFNKNIGLLPIYSECAEIGKFRSLYWNKTEPGYIEIRSGRTKEGFEKLDLANQEKGHSLLSLHVNSKGTHSAVWIAAAQYDEAKKFLAAHGITPAERKEN